ncbi:MAG: ROK family protein [Thermoproteota archaeon]
MLGIDLGATNTRIALANTDGKILFKYSEKTVEKSGSDVIRQIIEMTDKALSFLRFEKKDLKAIGIGSIGPLDLKKGLIINPPNLKVGVIPIVESLTRYFNVPVRLLNDCVSAVLGEKKFGAGKDFENIVYVTISTGIGCGVIVDGHLLLGKDGNAHEVGHLVVDKNGLLTCGCGKKGHWEAYCSGKGIINYARTLLEEWNVNPNESLLAKHCYGDFSKMTSELFFKAVREKDELALRILDKVNTFNTIGFANIINTYDPEIITVGGSVTLYNSEFILKPVKEGVSEYAINRIPEIILTPLGGDVVLYGALAAAIEQLA